MVKTYSSIRHLASLTAWLVTVAACLAMLLPATGSLTRLRPTLASVGQALTVDTPAAVSSLHPTELHPQVATVVPPSMQDELETQEYLAR